MSWSIFTGSGSPRVPDRAWESIPEPPPWRVRPAGMAPKFVADPKIVDAVNAALRLRRPLLLTGLPGSGKSTLVELIAAELQLGTVLRWHITSKSTLEDGLYSYDTLARLHASQMARRRDEAQIDPQVEGNDVARFVTLGPLGTALASTDRPRAVLIDEIDKSDLDLPGDLLDVLERGEYVIAPLARAVDVADEHVDVVHRLRGFDRGLYAVTNGVLQPRHLPVIVFTSNGERTFPPAFLRRCVRCDVPRPDLTALQQVVEAHLDTPTAATEMQTIREFATRIRQDTLAVDQLLNLLYLVTGDPSHQPGTATRARLEQILLEELSS